jgi:hypothetical protein
VPGLMKIGCVARAMLACGGQDGHETRISISNFFFFFGNVPRSLDVCFDKCDLIQRRSGFFQKGVMNIGTEEVEKTSCK